MNLRNRVISAGLALALACPLALAPVTALADPASELEAAAQRLEELGEQLTDTRDQLALAVQELEQTDYEIAEKSAQVEQGRAELSELQAQLGMEMRGSYKSGSATLLDFLLGSTSAEDLASRVYYLDKISQRKAEDIETVRTLASQLEQEISDLEGRQDAQSQLVSSLREQEDAYEAQVAEARDVYESLDAEARAAVAEQASDNVAAAVQAVETSQSQEAATSGSEGTGGGTQATTDDGQTQQQGGGEAQAPETDAGTGAESAPEATPEPEPDPQPSQPSAPAGGGVSTALAQVGKPYSYGATGPDAFDCSGLVCYSFGYALGRDTYSMISSLQSLGRWKTSMDELSYGDLVFPSTGHVGIYLGGGMMVHASSPGVGVVVAPVYSFIGGGSYY